ncbi:DUF3572 domain-containing protein [Beijerinckiaceae bacterium]|nr:DUF3572 domain-containing protein [Beijerinckiaceae bacterium]
MSKLNFLGPKPKIAKPSRDSAEMIAVDALSFLAGDAPRLERFLALSGLGLEHLRAAAADPGFLTAVLDHLGSDETLLLAFAGQSGHDPSVIAAARELLSRPAEAP